MGDIGFIFGYTLIFAFLLGYICGYYIKKTIITFFLKKKKGGNYG